MNSRELAEKIWHEAVHNAFDVPGENAEEDLEAEDRESALRIIEHLLEEHAGVKPDAELTKAREENAD